MEWKQNRIQEDENELNMREQMNEWAHPVVGEWVGVMNGWNGRCWQCEYLKCGETPQWKRLRYFLKTQMLNRKFYWNEYSSKFAIAIADAEAGAWLSGYVWNNKKKKFTDTFWSGLFINKKKGERRICRLRRNHHQYDVDSIVSKNFQLIPHQQQQQQVNNCVLCILDTASEVCYICICTLTRFLFTMSLVRNGGGSSRCNSFCVVEIVSV